MDARSTMAADGSPAGHNELHKCELLGQQEAVVVQELGLLIETWKSALVYLMETHMTEERMWGLMKSLGFPNGEVVAASGLSGGMSLFWRRDIIVSLQS
jgi:hypothetical protein